MKVLLYQETQLVASLCHQGVSETVCRHEGPLSVLTLPAITASGIRSCSQISSLN